MKILSIIKWILRLALVVLIVFTVGYVYFNYFDTTEAMSGDQIEIREELGDPVQFSITYLPKGTEGDGAEFVRQETWFYPDLKTRVTFLSGRLIATEDLSVAEGAEYWQTELKPENFAYDTSLEEVNALIGDYTLEPVEIPGFFGDGVETYAYAGGVFVFENGYLTYVETLD